MIRHEQGGFLIDGITTGGISAINVAKDVGYELGNFLSTGTSKGVPDITFGIESQDVTCEFEALICRLVPTGLTAGQEINLINAKAFDVIAPWKRGKGIYAVYAGVIAPYLNIESATYRYGVGNQKATQSFTARTDSAYLRKSVPYWQRFNLAGAGPYAFGRTAIKTVEQGSDVFALCVTLYHADGTYERLFEGSTADYTDTATNFTLTAVGLAKTVAGDQLETVYFSADPRTTAQADHPTAAVQPRNILGKDIDLYVGDGAATPTLLLQGGVQSVEFNWRITLDRDEELGNAHITGADYDVPTVSGTLNIKPRSIDAFFTQMHQFLGVPTTEVINVLSDLPVEINAVINHPDTGVPLKTIAVDDARFTMPPPQGRANSKVEFAVPFTSDSGNLYIVNGARL